MPLSAENLGSAFAGRWLAECLVPPATAPCHRPEPRERHKEVRVSSNGGTVTRAGAAMPFALWAFCFGSLMQSRP
jgi:hypothetical protein